MARRRVTVKTEKIRVSVHEHFKSLNDLITVMENRPFNKAFQNEENPSSQRDESKKDYSVVWYKNIQRRNGNNQKRIL